MSKENTIPYCGKKDFVRFSNDCKKCEYGTPDEDFKETGCGYCDYWDIHSPNECPDCHGSGLGFDGEQCDRCNGTGEKEN